MTGSERPAPPAFRVPEHDASGETRCGAQERTLLRVLIVEDSENDVLLLSSELRRSDYKPLRERAATPAKMEEALGRGPWDVGVADWRMPLMGATQPLTLLWQKGLDLPFDTVSGRSVRTRRWRS